MPVPRQVTPNRLVFGGANRGRERQSTCGTHPGVPTIHLKPGHVQPVWAGHPWVYAQAVERVEGGATAGDEVRVVDPRGNLMGRGFYSPKSAIVVRILARDDKTRIDGRFFHERIGRADAWRKLCELPSPDT